MNDKKLQLFNRGVLNVREASKLVKYNPYTAEYGLTLTEQQALELVETRNYDLRSSGRIEFGEGIIGKLILAFRTSPYLTQANYSETLQALIEIFYYYKNETLELLSDDDLIRYMRCYFNGPCCGSVELLASREMDHLARRLRGGADDAFREE